MPLIIENRNFVASAMETGTVNMHSYSAQNDVVLPSYPLPSVAFIREEIDRIMTTMLDEKTRNKFKKSLNVLDRCLMPAFHAATQGLEAETIATGRNWATTRFKALLLALRGPLSNTSLTFALKNPAETQAKSAATLLHGLAEVYTSKSTLDIIGNNGAGKRFETKQLAELFATTRRPGIESDEMKSFPLSRHVIVWRHGHAFSIDILDAKMQPMSVAKLSAQIQRLVDHSEASDSFQSVAGMSTFLDRPQWAAIYAEMKAKSPESIEVIESAIATVALHESVVRSQQRRLEVARADSQDVYSDKTLGFSVFPDGTLGGRIDHTVADGGVIVRFLQVLHAAMSKCSADVGMVAEGSPPLELPFHSIPSAVVPPTSQLEKGRKTFDIAQPPDVLDLLKSASLLNVTIQFAFQAAVFDATGSTGGLMVEPMSVRVFKDGRCDPNYIVTDESVALFRAMAAGEPDETLAQAFAASMLAYNKQVRRTRDGAAIGPGIMILRKVVESLPESEDRNIVLQVLQLFRRPSAYFTGVPYTDFVEAVEANVFAPDQLAITYIGKTDRITACLAGTGKFAGQLDAIHHLFLKYLRSLGMIATAIASVEQMYPGNGLAVLAGFAKDKGTVGEVGSVAIHAGAGEEFGLQAHEKKLVEFLLAVVVFVARQDIVAKRSAVEVVQKAVVALENCVFFNAGKGAVLNAIGEHELEACIVDGATGAAGAVACAKTLRNPIVAARLVMDTTEHSLLAGDAADQFGAEHGLQPVPNVHFSSHARKQQRQRQREAKITANHPQTVGAVVLDTFGSLAVATSTGGVVNKKPGRIGDTAIVGAGVFADHRIAVACSGQGDAFLRKSIASQIAYSPSAMQTVLDELYKKVSANGAALTVDSSGRVRIAQTSGSFLVASSEKGQPIWSKVVVQDRTPRELPTFFEDSNVKAIVSPRPTTPGDTLVRVKAGPLRALSRTNFADTLISIKQVATVLKASTDVQRIGLVTTSNDEVRLIPLHGLSAEWKPAFNPEEEYHTSFPGYISSKNGPESSNETLTKVQKDITRDCAPAMDLTFIGEKGKDNLFAKIIRGKLEQWRVWESKTHVAFLTPFGNTPGFTVLVPRKHLSSDILSIADTDLYDLAGAIYDVSKLIEQSALGATRVGLIFEGMEINYAHAKLIPILGDEPCAHVEETFKDVYSGYLSSKPGPIAPYEFLEPLQLKLMSTANTMRIIVPTKTWQESASHYLQALKSPWYRGIIQLLDSLFHGTAEYFNKQLAYKYAITPLTTGE